MCRSVVGRLKDAVDSRIVLNRNDVEGFVDGVMTWLPAEQAF